jgi:purine nucleoside phosphorylase
MTSTAQDAAEIIQSHNKLGVAGAAIILDHNLYNVAELADNAVSIRYADLPGFPQTPSTQDAELVIGAIEGIPTLVLKGCTNFHEIGDSSLMAGPIEIQCFSIRLEALSDIESDILKALDAAGA